MVIPGWWHLLWIFFSHWLPACDIYFLNMDYLGNSVWFKKLSGGLSWYSVEKILPPMQETLIQSPDQEDPQTLEQQSPGTTIVGRMLCRRPGNASMRSCPNYPEAWACESRCVLPRSHCNEVRPKLRGSPHLSATRKPHPATKTQHSQSIKNN